MSLINLKLEELKRVRFILFSLPLKCFIDQGLVRWLAGANREELVITISEGAKSGYCDYTLYIMA